jgi:hypothetical protein
MLIDQPKKDDRKQIIQDVMCRAFGSLGTDLILRRWKMQKTKNLSHQVQCGLMLNRGRRADKVKEYLKDRHWHQSMYPSTETQMVASDELYGSC